MKLIYLPKSKTCSYFLNICLGLNKNDFTITVLPAYSVCSYRKSWTEIYVKWLKTHENNITRLCFKVGKSAPSVGQTDRQTDRMSGAMKKRMQKCATIITTGHAAMPLHIWIMRSEDILSHSDLCGGGGRQKEIGESGLDTKIKK